MIQAALSSNISGYFIQVVSIILPMSKILAVITNHPLVYIDMNQKIIETN